MSSTPTDQSSALISSEKYYLVKSVESMGPMDRNFNNNNVTMNNGVDTHNLWKYNKHPHHHHHQQHQHHHQQLMQSYNNISNGIASDSGNVIGNNSQQMLSGVHQRQQQQQQPLSATTESGVGREYIHMWRKCIKILKLCLFYGDFWLLPKTIIYTKS